MKELPHLYKAQVEGAPEKNLNSFAENLPTLEVAPPKQFGGPGDQWSPEELLLAAVANCIVLSFRAIARMSKLGWVSIECESQGKLDKVNGTTKFTEIRSKARLVIVSGADKEKAEKLLVKAEQTCFVSNSLAVETHMECDIAVSSG